MIVLAGAKTPRFNSAPDAHLMAGCAASRVLMKPSQYDRQNEAGCQVLWTTRLKTSCMVSLKPPVATKDCFLASLTPVVREHMLACRSCWDALPAPPCKLDFEGARERRPQADSHPADKSAKAGKLQHSSTQELWILWLPKLLPSST